MIVITHLHRSEITVTVDEVGFRKANIEPYEVVMTMKFQDGSKFEYVMTATEAREIGKSLIQWSGNAVTLRDDSA